MRVVSCLFTEHNLWLVALAAVVCISGSAITFGLFTRARERTGLQKQGWTFLTAVAAGSSMWCTHFIAMLAYEVSAPVAFDPFLTMASLIVAIVGCGVGFGLSAVDEKRFPPEVCGAVVGISVALMHYTGMAAYHVSGLVEWSTRLHRGLSGDRRLRVGLALREAVRNPRACRTNLHSPLRRGDRRPALYGDGRRAGDAAGGRCRRQRSPAFAAIAVAVAGVGLMVIGTGVASYLIDERTSADTVERLRQMALNDALTGLPNRAQFSDYLDRELERAQANNWTVAVLGIDLDRFKEINDLHGHAAGDKALKIMGERLAELLQPGEFVARVGGDEFAAVSGMRAR